MSARGARAPQRDVTILVNGETHSVPEGTTIAAFLSVAGIASSRVAVEVNGAIVRRERYAARPLLDGDRVELVQFVGGG